MTDARQALALEKRDNAFKNHTKIVCITKADAQLAIARLQGGLQELAANGLRRRRGTVIRARGQPEAQPLGGPARELPDSVLEQLQVHYIKSDSGELEPALFRWMSSKKEEVLRRWVPIDDMAALVDTEYTFNCGKKAGINSLETRLDVDPQRLCASGFSDGASYALSLGAANGDLFTHIAAFSPGFMRQPVSVGKPLVYISHGIHDRVLRIDYCSRRIAPRLEAEGYLVNYHEFDGPHIVPASIAREALAWFVGSKGQPASRRED